MEIYDQVNSVMSKNEYVPAIAALELISLLITYVAGMGIAVYKLPLLGVPITAHIYAAAADVVLVIFLYGAAARSSRLALKVISLIDALCIIGAAFSGLFYFGGFSFPIYALGMGTGFVLGVAVTSFLLFYSVRR